MVYIKTVIFDTTLGVCTVDLTLMGLTLINDNHFRPKLMHSTTFVLILGMVLLSSSIQSNLISEQKKYERVRTAIDEKQDYLKRILSQKNMTLDNLHLLLVAYKEDNLLEVYAKTKQETNSDDSAEVCQL